MWGRTGNAHCEILPVISNCLPVMDEPCKRRRKFTAGCIVSGCTVVCRLARSALPVGGINSILDRNAIFFSIRYTGWILLRGNMDISCARTFYESLVELRLKGSANP